MNESRAFNITLRRIILPFLLAVGLVIATLLISGSALLRIEDTMISRILAGTYGTPDWRVQEMNPLLSQVLSLLYRIIPSINWYGVLLLALLCLAIATVLGLCGRKPGGLLCAAVVASPLLVLLTNSMFSTAVCAVCAGAGAFSLMDGLQHKKEGTWRIGAGAILFLFSAMISITWAVLLGLCAAVCWLPSCLRDNRVKGLLLGLPVMAVMAAALFGYSALMYNSPELFAYHNDYALYERLQYSSLNEESVELLNTYGSTQYTDEDHAGHDHDGDGLPDGEEHASEEDVVIPPNVFDTVGWSLNDASLFFSRSAVDTQLTDPETLRVLEKEARFISYDIGRLARETLNTLKKPQFLLMIMLLVFSALIVVVPSRRKGLIALLAALVAFGGHIVSLMRYRNAFADIAPYYLVAIIALLYHFDGEDAKAWFQRTLSSRWLRMGISAAVCVVFVGGMAGLLYYTRITPANANEYTVQAVNFLKPYIRENADMLFIGDNPGDRYKPGTLAVPVRGEDQNLLAGSYDLYSPRAAALMQKFGIENPLVDCLGREDIAYVSMAFSEPVSVRLASAYNLYAKPAEVLLGYTDFGEQIIRLSAFTQEEIDEILRQAELEREQAEIIAEMLADPAVQAMLENLPEGGEDADAHDTESGGDGGEPAAEPSASPVPNA